MEERRGRKGRTTTRKKKESKSVDSTINTVFIFLIVNPLKRLKARKYIHNVVC